MRDLPQVDRLAQALPAKWPAPQRVAAARSVVTTAGERIAAGAESLSFDELITEAAGILRKQSRSDLRPVINATGVLLHTNLGRAPLAPAALESIGMIARGYSNLEFDLEQRSRGSRYSHACALLTQLTGAGAAVVVNNNAAALMLALQSLCLGREAIVSRGELIEIGGEFRLPEIMGASGAVMREVGTTNRTHLRDYVRAIGPQTGAIVRVHPSNFSISGFTASVSTVDLARLAAEHGLPLIVDLGTGLPRRSISGTQPDWLRDEPTVAETVATGADVVTFSCDKLLGGPQAGVIAGKPAMLDAVHASPLLRAVRVDKMTLAALNDTLFCWLQGDERELPLWKMALMPAEEIRARATSVVEGVAGTSIVEGYSTAGGGAAPDSRIPTSLIVVSGQLGARFKHDGEKIAASFVDREPPIVGRIADDRFLIDLRTVDPRDDAEVRAALQSLT